MTEANHRIHASFIEQTPCCVAPAGTTGSRGVGVANGHGVLGRAAALWPFSPGSEDRRTAVSAGPAGTVRAEKVAARERPVSLRDLTGDSGKLGWIVVFTPGLFPPE